MLLHFHHSALLSILQYMVLLEYIHFVFKGNWVIVSVHFYQCMVTNLASLKYMFMTLTLIVNPLFEHHIIMASFINQRFYFYNICYSFIILTSTFFRSPKNVYLLTKIFHCILKLWTPNTLTLNDIITLPAL